MKILVINCGSSSIKYKLYDMTDKSVLAAGGIEKVGLAGSFNKVALPNGEKKIISHECPTHTEGIKLMFDTLLDPEIGAIKSLDEIDAAGHRIVAGGTYTKSQIVTDEMLEGWKPFMELAPLHSPAHLKGYLAVRAQLPNLPQVFVFDTAFNFRRYGAHGTSHRYVTARAGEVLGFDPKDVRMITCHIGNGASISAVDHGKCVDTSMGLTPLEGVMMGTRTGDIDSSAILYIMEKEHQTPEEAIDLLNKKSGLLGISGVSSDMREVEDAAEKGNERARLALDMYSYRIKKYIGAYTAVMGGVDVIVFTAGVGEHQWDVRKATMEGMEYLGIQLDQEKNERNNGEEELISLPESKVKVAVIPTDEELMIATDTMQLVTKQ